MKQIRKHNVTVLNLDNPESHIKTMYLGYRQCYFQGKLSEEYAGIKDRNLNDEEINYLKRMLVSGHDSPVEHSKISFILEDVSISLLRQLIRHRLISTGEKSLRYTNAREFNIVIPPTFDTPDKRHLLEEGLALMEMCEAYYNKCLDAKIPNEDARYLSLPVGATTSVIMSLNIRELLHVFSERCCTVAQWEIRNAMNELRDEFVRLFPMFEDIAGPKCIKHKRCPEKKSCGRYPKYE